MKGNHEIVDIQILNPYQAPRLEYLKYTLLDIHALDKRGITFVVEMQVEEIEGDRKRFQYYAAKAYAGQIERGEDYPKLNQVIFIGILNFTAFENKNYLSRHLIRTYARRTIEIDPCGQSRLSTCVDKVKSIVLRKS